MEHNYSAPLRERINRYKQSLRNLPCENRISDTAEAKVFVDSGPPSLQQLIKVLLINENGQNVFE